MSEDTLDAVADILRDAERLLIVTGAGLAAGAFDGLARRLGV